MRDIFTEMRTLTSISALSGQEDRLIARVADALRGFGLEPVVDFSGNVSATIPGAEDASRSLLIFGHMDEVGLMVRRITEDGFLRFDRIGGPSDKTMRGQMVEVLSADGQREYPGVVGTKAHHLTTDAEKNLVPSRMDMYIDIGATSKREVLDMGIDIGSAITYMPNFQRIGRSRISAKCIDNRAAVWTVLSLAEHFAKNPPPITVHCGFTVQEEFNVRGGLPLVRRLKPDMVISVDCAISCDTPDLNMEYDTRMGAGAVITQMNSYGKGPIGGLLPNPKFKAFIEKCAKEAGLPYQKEAMGTGVLSDASYVQMQGELGIVTAHIGFPIRYAHCPAEMADTKDIEACRDILRAVIENMRANVDFRRL